MGLDDRLSVVMLRRLCPMLYFGTVESGVAALKPRYRQSATRHDDLAP